MPKKRADFAFPKEGKEPLNTPGRVRNAAARLDQVRGVSSTEKEEAKRKIVSAEKRDGIKGGNRPTW